MLSEFRSNQFCRELRLPAEVDPVKTTAVLKDGVLELVVAKVAESKAVNVEVESGAGHSSPWNFPRKLPITSVTKAHFNALLRWRLNISLMAKQLLSKSRTTECEAPLWQKKRF